MFESKEYNKAFKKSLIANRKLLIDVVLRQKVRVEESREKRKVITPEQSSVKSATNDSFVI